MDIATPEWHDVYSTEELAVALDHHAAMLAAKHGAYAVADELRFAAACIRDLADDDLRSAGSELVRNILTAKESLTSRS